MTTADWTVVFGFASFVASAAKYLKDSKTHQAERQEQTKQLQEQTKLLQEIRDSLTNRYPG